MRLTVDSDARTLELPADFYAKVAPPDSDTDFQAISGPEATARFDETVEKGRRTGTLGTTTR